MNMKGYSSAANIFGTISSDTVMEKMPAKEKANSIQFQVLPPGYNLFLCLEDCVILLKCSLQIKIMIRPNQSAEDGIL